SVTPTGARIDWGDGGVTAGQLAANAQGGYDVSGSYTYAEETGSTPFTVTVTLTGPGGDLASPAQILATVADAPLSGSPVRQVLSPNQAFTGVIARFHDANPRAPAGDFTAKVNWGDNSSGDATVSADGGGNFSVSGSHSYSD